MNLTAVLNFESMIIKGAQAQSIELNTFIAHSLRIIIEKVFLEAASSFVIVVSCRRSGPLNFYLDILQHLFRIVDNMVVQLIFIKYGIQANIEGPRLYNLLLVDSLEAFLDIDVNSHVKKTDQNEFYYIFLMQRDARIPSDMNAIFEYCWQNNLINCNIQIQNALEELHMYTYFPYTPDQCGNTKAQHINQFVGKNWLQKPYFLGKLRNFYKCPLIAVVRNIAPFLIIRNDSQSHRINHARGLEMNLINELAIRLNFTLILKEASVDERTGITAGGALEMLTKNKADFALGFFRNRAVLSTNFTITFPHYQSNIMAVLYIKAYDLSSLQVFTFPFSQKTWIALSAFTSLLLILTYFLNRSRTYSSKCLNIINMIGCLLGVPTTAHPRSKPFTILYSSWLWQSFFLRSIYSALLYLLFRSHIHQHIPQTLKEVVDLNYMAVLNQFTFNDIRTIPYYRIKHSKSIIIDSSDEAVSLKYLEEYSNSRQVALIAEEFVLHYVESMQKPGQFFIVPEVLVQQQLSIYLCKHSYLISLFDNEIINIKSMGIMKSWMLKQLNPKYFQSTHMREEQMIEQSDLYAIYIMCISLYLLCILIFIIELSLRKVNISKYSWKVKCRKSFWVPRFLLALKKTKRRSEQ